MAVFGQFVVFFLKTEEPLHKTVQQLLLRLFLDDAACNFFFMNYGGCKFQSQRALDVEGDFARIPPSGASAFFVENMNHFGRCGGYDALHRRLLQEVGRGICLRTVSWR